MRRRLIVSAVSLALILPLPLFAQTRGVVDLATGIHQVEEGELEAAVLTLDAVVQRLSAEGGREKDLATAHLYLGVAHLGISQLERAKADLRDAWRNNRELTLDPKKFSPRVRQLYEEAREEARKAEPGRRASSQTTPPAQPAPVQAVTAEKTQQKGGGHTKLILLGVGGAALVGGGIAVAGKGNNNPPPPVTTPPGPTGTITLLSTSPASGGTVSLPVGWPGNRLVQGLTVTVQFTYSESLTNASVFVALTRGSSQCLVAEGLVLGGPYGGPFNYVAGSTVTKTGNNFTGFGCGDSGFTTDHLQILLIDQTGPNKTVLVQDVTMGWTFK